MTTVVSSGVPVCQREVLMSREQEFVCVWEMSASVAQVVRYYGSSLAEVLSCERWFRQEGVGLKDFSPEERNPAQVFGRLMDA